MNIPSLSCKIEMFCTINPSESSKKIEKAISNIGLTKDELLKKSYEIIQRWIE